MKIIGSMLEDRIKKTVETSRIDSKDFKGDPRVLKVLQDNVENFRYAYLIGYAPEQAEDIFLYLVDSNTIITIEVSRIDLNEKVIFEKMTVESFMEGPKSKDKILTMQMTLEMLENDLKELEK